MAGSESIVSVEKKDDSEQLKQGNEGLQGSEQGEQEQGEQEHKDPEGQEGMAGPESDGGEQSDDIMTPEGFRKATHVYLARRGKFLSRIDETLKEYSDYMQSNGKEDDSGDKVKADEKKTGALKRLADLEEACKAWLSEHAGTKYVISVVKRRPAVEKLKERADSEIVKVKESLSQTQSGEGSEGQSKDESLNAFNGKGLVPYERFKESVDGVKFIKFISLSPVMKLRRFFGKDAHLVKLLGSYEEYDKKARGTETEKPAEKDSYKDAVRSKYTSLLNLEKACNDWLDAHESQTGMLYQIKTAGVTPVTVRRGIIAPLVQPGGAIENEKNMIETSLDRLNSIAQKEKSGEGESEPLQIAGLGPTQLDTIYDIETFKKLTNPGWFSKRGDNLQKIDGLIIKYHQSKEEKNTAQTSEFLKQLFSATTYWLKLHEDDTNASYQYRLPVIRDVRDAARNLLKQDNVAEEDIEKLDSGKNMDAARGFRGVEKYSGSLLSIDQFRKLTYAGKTSRRGAVISRIDNLIAQYNEAEKTGEDDKINALLEQIQTHTKYWLDIHQNDKTGSVQYRYPVIKDLNAEVNHLLQQKKGAPAKSEQGSEEETDAKQAGGKKTRVLPTIDEFKKMTYAGKTSTRGDYLSEIDKAIMQYDKYRVKTEIEESEQENAVNVLGNIHRSCMIWLQRHKGQGGGSIGLRRVFIEKMVGEEGLVANETNSLIQNKILTKEVDISDKIISAEGASGGQPGSVFQSIGSEYSDELGNQNSHLKIALYASISAPYVPGTSAKITLFYEYDGERTGDVDDPDKEVSKDNIRSKVTAQHKFGVGLSAKLLFVASAGVNANFGFYTKASANSADGCAKLMKFCTYNKIRRNRLMPRWLTNKFYGGSFGNEGYMKSEQSQSEAVNVLAKDGKNYVEEGKSVGGGANAGVMVLASAQTSTDIRGFRKRITRDVIMKTLAEMGAPKDIPYENLADEYLKRSGIEDGQVKENHGAEMHRKIHENKQEKEKSRLTRTITKRIKRADVIKDYKNGVLRNIRMENSFDTDAFIAGKGYYKGIMDMIRLLQDDYGGDGADSFNILDLDLDSFKSDIISRIEEYPPLIQLRNSNALMKLIKGKSIKLALEVDTKKKMMKLYITKIDLGSDILGLTAMAATTDTALKVLDLAGQSVALPVKASAGPEFEFSKKSECLLGFWKLPNSKFEASKAVKPPVGPPETGTGPEPETTGDKQSDIQERLIAELKAKLAEREKQKGKQ